MILQFPEAMLEKLARYKDKRVVLQTYNKTMITQLGVCRMTIRYMNYININYADFVQYKEAAQHC